MTAAPLDPATETFLARRRLAQRMLVTRLATLRRIVQRSASIALVRASGLNDFDWLVVSFVGLHDRPAVAAEIGERLQRDKAQISRALARLTRAGLLSRARRRAPLMLTEIGRRLYERIEAVLVARNAALLEGLDEESLGLLDPTLDKLFKGANALLGYERALAGGADADDARPVERPARDDDLRKAHERGAPKLIVPDLQVLLRLMRRSADLAYGRVTGLKNFDWRTLTHIEMFGPLTLTDLIVGIDRNKSQVGRAVGRLVTLGLVARRREKGAASVVLSGTDAGRAAFDLIMTEAQRREAALVGELTIREYRGFVAALDRLTQNALAMLDDERGVADAAAPTATRAARAGGD
jgi:DNA-binding MarR family transcriptional regulator